MLVIDREDPFIAPMHGLPEDRLTAHHLLVLLTEAPAQGYVGPSDIEAIREDCRDEVRFQAALWSGDFHLGWTVTWPSGPAPVPSLIAPASGRRARVVDVSLFSISRQGRGAVSYSDLERQCHEALGAQLYLCARLLSGAIARTSGIATAERQAAEILVPTISPVRGVLRSSGPRGGEFDLYDKLRNETGTARVRTLYGEPRNSAALAQGKRWFEFGAIFAAECPDLVDVEHQIPDIADEIRVLDGLVALRLRAASLARREREAGWGRDYRTEPLAQETVDLAFAQLEDSITPDFGFLTRLARTLEYDASGLFPHAVSWKAHLAAQIAIGAWQHRGQRDIDTLTRWGLRGLLDKQFDRDVGQEFAELREALRAKVPHELFSEAQKIPASLGRKLGR